MQQAAAALMFFGFGSIVLHLIGMQFRILAWIDMWGLSVGWTIRAGMAVAGVALFFVARRMDSGEEAKTAS